MAIKICTFYQFAADLICNNLALSGAFFKVLLFDLNQF